MNNGVKKGNEVLDRNVYKNDDPKNVIYQAKPRLYENLVFPVWAILCFILGLITYFKGFVPDMNMDKPFLAWFVWVVFILNCIYFFMVCQGIMYVIRYHHVKDDEADTEKRTLSLPMPTGNQWEHQLKTHHEKPKVALIYCTYNDFLPDCLYQCLKAQTYPVDVKILDDSSKDEYIEAVDKFASLHSDRVQVIRRIKHRNDKNKAGNLNHGLEAIKDQHYDFYVFLDSDELLEPNFVRKMLKMFYYGDTYGYHVGLIQADHKSGRNTNQFMKMNEYSALYFWPVQNVVRSVEAGVRIPKGLNHKPFMAVRGDTICANLGHGCMADAHALYASGLFPNVVSEDVASTMNMIKHGYNTYFASQIYGNEETVTDMNAMKTRATKFANGDMQWCRKYRRLIRKTSMMSKLQKLDTTTLMGLTNMSALLYVSVIFYNVLYPWENSLLGTSLIFLIPLIVFLYSSGIIDTVMSLNCMSVLATIKREFEVLATFSSTYYLSVKATYGQLILHHKAKFKVTPKTAVKVRWRDAIKDNLGEMIFSLLTIIISFIFCGWTAWMVLLAFVPPLFSPFAELMTNHQTKKQKRLTKVFQLHQQQALQYKTVPTDDVWTDWTV